jgi:sialic acid synthase SpsE
MAREMMIGDRWIGESHPVFIIAEASTNHNGDLALAKEMVRAAKEIGVDCIKFQTFTPSECLTPGKTFTYRSQGREVTEDEYAMFVRLAFTRDQWAELMAFCDAEGVLFLTTVQDSIDLQMMLDLGLKGIKKGSDDFDFLPNLIEAAETGLPLILSKGMADLGEVDSVIRAVNAHTDKLAVLHCVSLYPSDPIHLNIRQIPKLKSLYPDIIWGFSDHSMGPLASTIAVALGAKIVEKHFTLGHDLPGPDHWFSMDVKQMDQLVRDIRFAEQAIGSGSILPAVGEQESRKIMRRRIVARMDLPAGAMVDRATIQFKRAESGSFLDHWEILQGKRLRVAKRKDQGITLADVEH